MTKAVYLTVSVLALSACSHPAPKSDGRGPASVIDQTGTVVKKLGVKTQVIASGVINKNADAETHGQVAFDVLCPATAPEVYSGGCTITEGDKAAKKPASTGVVTGLYPLVSAESGEGYRCIFDRTKRRNEISAMAFCRKAVRARAPVAVPSPAPATEQE